jgi:hypothetical protein
MLNRLLLGMNNDPSGRLVARQARQQTPRQKRFHRAAESGFKIPSVEQTPSFAFQKHRYLLDEADAVTWGRRSH